MIGSGTVLADNPSLTVRDVTPLPTSPPLRVAVDATGRLDPTGALFDLSLAPTLIVTSDQCPLAKRTLWEKAGIEVVSVPKDSEGHLIILSLLKLLGERGIIQLLVEGGPTLLGQFIQTPYPNELILYYGAQILGDSGLPLFKNYFVNTMKDAKQCTLAGVEKMGECVRLNYTIGNT
jgi:diaminohydroxyphosphoribosylaminopyrimidine deaminase/5-amino-6-(5-phosphoribosylamino)uracil reductase